MVWDLSSATDLMPPEDDDDYLDSADATVYSDYYYFQFEEDLEAGTPYGILLTAADTAVVAGMYAPVGMYTITSTTYDGDEVDD